MKPLRRTLNHGTGLAHLYRNEFYGLVADRIAMNEMTAIEAMKARLKRTLRAEGKLREDA